MSVSFSWNEVREITGGQWLRAPGVGEGVECVEDDSRKVCRGAFFIAIRGELVDGHRYVDKALAAGAAGICVEREPESGTRALLEEKNASCLLVEDTLVAFQELARAHRRRFAKVALVGITGSCGKTSTKEMLASIFTHCWPGRVLKTQGNFNNHFGVPRTLFGLTGETRAAVIEMGTNHPGEIANLVRLAEPDVGMVSNIGAAHLEFFGDLEGVAREKGDMLAGTAPTGICVLPAEAAHVEILRQKASPRRVLDFGTGGGAFVQVDYFGASGGGFSFELRWRNGERRRVFWNIGGAHQALNAAAAAAAATAVGISPDDIAAGLQECELPGMRMKSVVRRQVHFCNDAYNANPSSMEAGLVWFREIVPGGAQPILVLGDMLELGDGGQVAHRQALGRARELFPQARILAVGPLMCEAAKEYGIEGMATAAEAAAKLETWCSPQSWVFLKASRGIVLEVCIPAAEA